MQYPISDTHQRYRYVQFCTDQIAPKVTPKQGSAYALCHILQKGSILGSLLVCTKEGTSRWSCGEVALGYQQLWQRKSPTSAASRVVHTTLIKRYEIGRNDMGRSVETAIAVDKRQHTLKSC